MKKIVGITTVSFSKNNYLRDKASKLFDEVIFNPVGRRLTLDEVKNIYKKCTALIVGLDKVDEQFLDSLPMLKVISKFGVGFDNINFEACSARGVNVCLSKGVNSYSVAELVLCFMIGFLRKVFVNSFRMKRGEWVKDGGISLSSKTVGIIGVGNIGKEVVRLLKPFGCKILCNDIVCIEEFCKQNNVKSVSKEYIFRNADIITLHVPLTDKTKYLINKDTLSLMKSSALLINTSRGDVVNIDDLKESLNNNRIGGVCLDVFPYEPFDDLNFCSRDNVICTPHIAGNSKEAVISMGESAINALVSWFKENNI